MIKFATFAAAAILAAPAAFADTFKTDQGHTEVLFSWSHAGVSTQNAEFTSVDGTLDLDPANPEAASLNVTIKADSLSTGFDLLNEHLSAADFFDVANNPEITFVSTGVEKTGDDTAKITGDLTIKGVTQPVVLDAKMNLLGNHPLGGAIEYYQGDWAAFQATTTIDHMAFGVGPFPTGPITVTINTELKAQ